MIVSTHSSATTRTDHHQARSITIIQKVPDTDKHAPRRPHTPQTRTRDVSNAQLHRCRRRQNHETRRPAPRTRPSRCAPNLRISSTLLVAGDTEKQLAMPSAGREESPGRCPQDTWHTRAAEDLFCFSAARSAQDNPASARAEQERGAYSTLILAP